MNKSTIVLFLSFLMLSTPTTALKLTLDPPPDDKGFKDPKVKKIVSIKLEENDQLHDESNMVDVAVKFISGYLSKLKWHGGSLKIDFEDIRNMNNVAVVEKLLDKMSDDSTTKSVVWSIINSPGLDNGMYFFAHEKASNIVQAKVLSYFPQRRYYYFK